MPRSLFVRYHPAARAFKDAFMRHPAALLPALLLAGCGFVLEGEVARVVDGDTVDLLHDGVRDRIRFYGVDCPEIGQPYGAEAAALIRRLSPVGQRVTVHVRFALRDSFNRLREEPRPRAPQGRPRLALPPPRCGRPDAPLPGGEGARGEAGALGRLRRHPALVVEKDARPGRHRPAMRPAECNGPLRGYPGGGRPLEG